MFAITMLKDRLVGIIRTRQSGSGPLQVDDRYWGIDSALERLDGRYAREEYYERYIWGGERPDVAAEDRGLDPTPDDADFWRAEVERARLESVDAYENFLDTLLFYYAETAGAAEMSTRDG